MATDHPSWKVKGEATLPELVTLMDLTNEDKALLKNLAPQAKDNAADMTKMFYERLFKQENTADYLQGASMDRLHSMVGEWYVDLFSGTYDAAYAQKRLVIGQIHVRIGLPVRYPLAMLDVIMQFGDAVARQSPKPDQALAAFHKVLALDVAIFNQAFEDNQLKHLAELVGGERLARLLLSGQA
jgi:hypothetical protein